MKIKYGTFISIRNQCPWGEAIYLDQFAWYSCMYGSHIPFELSIYIFIYEEITLHGRHSVPFSFEKQHKCITAYCISEVMIISYRGWRYTLRVFTLTTMALWINSCLYRGQHPAPLSHRAEGVYTVVETSAGEEEGDRISRMMSSRVHSVWPDSSLLMIETSTEWRNVDLNNGSVSWLCHTTHVCYNNNVWRISSHIIFCVP